MCRIYGFCANEPTKVECTLVYAQNALLIQSRRDAVGDIHGDGWGIGIYRDGAPRVERAATPAWEGLHFSAAAERAFAERVVAHVRKGTYGTPSVTNTHPFVHGRWTFAHNGALTGWKRLEPRIAEETPPELRPLRRGGTDSELVFLWLLGRLEAAGVDLEEPPASTGELAGLVGSAVRELAERCAEAADPDEEPSALNFLLTDGERMLLTRWGKSLHWLERDGIHDCEICGIPHVRHRQGVDYRAVVVASEPISDEPWREVPDRSAIAVDPALGVAIAAI